MIYENLIKKYEELTEEEKNILLVYKSRLGRAINSLDNNGLEIIEIYERYKSLVENPKNLFMKFSVFKDISFKSLEEFIESLIKIKEKLNEISKKIILTEDITVYRAFSISDEEELISLSKDNLVSTSLNINECSKYLIPNKDYTHYLYQINLEKGSMVTICPYRILIDNNDRLTLTKENDSEELNIISVNAISKVKDTKQKR